MQKISPFVYFSALALFLTCPLVSCTSTGVPGEGVSSEGYTSKPPVSPVERTENMRSQYREQLR